MSQFRAPGPRRTFGIASRILILLTGLAILAALSLVLPGCGNQGGGDIFKSGFAQPTGPAPAFTTADIQQVMARAAGEAERVGASATVAVVTREGQIVGVFSMTGSPTGPAFPGVAGTQPCDSGGVNCAIAKARTAAFFSSVGETFSTRTALFIVQDNFPPNVFNRQGGPLYGVQNSSLAGSDVLAISNGIVPNGITGVSGGLALYNGGFPVGAVGISSDKPELDEQIALVAQRGLPPHESIHADKILIDGFRLPYVTSNDPGLTSSRTFADLGVAVAGSFPFPVAAAPALIFPAATFAGVTGELRFPIIDSPAAVPTKLLASDVGLIFQQAIARAAQTRAEIRRPLGEAARVFVSVTDVNGVILGVFRMPDATLFSFDVAVQKARTSAFFSSNNILGEPLTANFKNLLQIPATQQIAMSTRGLGFMAQGFYPPGISGTAAGPIFQVQDRLGLKPFGNGITVFPGGLPLYKDGQLVGGIGVSGDGVDQDDIICDSGAVGFEPPPSVLRSDQLFFDNARIPYVKHPRNPLGASQ